MSGLGRYFEEMLWEKPSGYLSYVIDPNTHDGDVRNAPGYGEAGFYEVRMHWHDDTCDIQIVPTWKAQPAERLNP